MTQIVDEEEDVHPLELARQHTQKPSYWFILEITDMGRQPLASEKVDRQTQTQTPAQAQGHNTNHPYGSLPNQTAEKKSGKAASTSQMAIRPVKDPKVKSEGKSGERMPMTYAQATDPSFQKNSDGVEGKKELSNGSMMSLREIRYWEQRFEESLRAPEADENGHCVV